MPLPAQVQRSSACQNRIHEVEPRDTEAAPQGRQLLPARFLALGGKVVAGHLSPVAGRPGLAAALKLAHAEDDARRSVHLIHDRIDVIHRVHPPARLNHDL